jgi:hypothetical protein
MRTRFEIETPLPVDEVQRRLRTLVHPEYQWYEEPNGKRRFQVHQEFEGEIIGNEFHLRTTMQVKIQPVLHGQILPLSNGSSIRIRGTMRPAVLVYFGVVFVFLVMLTFEGISERPWSTLGALAFSALVLAGMLRPFFRYTEELVDVIRQSVTPAPEPTEEPPRLRSRKRPALNP